MRLADIFDNLDQEAADNLGAPLEEFQRMVNKGPVWKLSIIISAALSTDPRIMFRAQQAYRLLRCLVEPKTFTCPCTR